MKLPVLLFAAGIGAYAHASTLDAERVEQEINTFGSHYVIARYFECDRSGEAAYDQVATGSANWLAIATRLLKESDACVTDGIHDAIARALPRAPAQVLALVDSDENMKSEQICAPFLSVEEPSAPQLQLLSRLRNALMGVVNPELERQKSRCLAQVDEAELAVRRALTLQSTGTQ